MNNGIFCVYLLWASCQDAKEMLVVRYTHLLGLLGIAAEAVYCIWHGQESWLMLLTEWMLAVFFHGILQVVAVHFQLYGVADGFIFFMCSMFWTVRYGMVMSFFEFFGLQMIAGSLLLAVQIRKRNLKGASLKAPVPYIPYISVAFFLTNGVL